MMNTLCKICFVAGLVLLPVLWLAPLVTVICQGFTIPFWLHSNIITVRIHSWPVWTPDNPVNNAINPAEYTKLNDKQSNDTASARSSWASYLVFHFLFSPPQIQLETLRCQKPSFTDEGILLDSARKRLPQNSLSCPFCQGAKSHICEHCLISD